MSVVSTELLSSHKTFLTFKQLWLTVTTARLFGSIFMFVIMGLPMVYNAILMFWWPTPTIQAWISQDNNHVLVWMISVKFICPTWTMRCNVCSWDCKQRENDTTVLMLLAAIVWWRCWQSLKLGLWNCHPWHYIKPIFSLFNNSGHSNCICIIKEERERET